MGLIAVVLIPVLLFCWFAAWLTVWAWLRTIANLCERKFVRASLWSCVGTAMLVWWDGRYSWDEFLPLYVALVGTSVIGSAWRYLKQTLQARNKPFSPTSGHKIAANDNQLVVFSLHAKSKS